MDPENRDNIEIQQRRLTMRVIRVTWIFTCIAVVLLAVGFVTPGFGITKYSNLTRYSGLWYWLDCENGTCATVSNDYKISQIFLRAGQRNSGDVTNPYIVYPILATFAVAFGIVSIITELILRRSNLSLAAMQWTSVVLFLAKISSGFFVLATTIQMSKGKLQLEVYYRDSKTTLYFPFSLFLFGVGGTIMFVVSILPHMNYIYRHNRYAVSGNVQRDGRTWF